MTMPELSRYAIISFWFFPRFGADGGYEPVFSNFRRPTQMCESSCFGQITDDAAIPLGRRPSNQTGQEFGLIIASPSPRLIYALNFLFWPET